MLKIEFPEKSILNSSLVWITDLHIDACDSNSVESFVSEIKNTEANIVLVGGDICNGPNSFEWLESLQLNIGKEVFFVLGNHDYYNSSILQTRINADKFNKEQSHCHYLCGNGAIALSDKTALVGHDGWADGRAGDFVGSSVMLNDYVYIEEFKYDRGEKLLRILNHLGTEAAKTVKKTILEIIVNYENIIFLTHVPPFKEACVYKGKVTDDNWGPHFVCHAMGEVLLEIAEIYPDKQILCLCGHSHSEADINVKPNLRVVAGASELGVPSIQGVVNFM